MENNTQSPTLDNKKPETISSFAVVGAGVVGLCVALEAQRRGHKVTLI